ncbi:MAG TPA: NAD-binding protein, partial [Actinomycetota bacterium]|nr:NAD-binding protein [Actinomycetota bacterium]
MRVVVTGGGAIGRHVAADLTTRGHEVTLIEQDKETVEDLRAEIPGVTIMLGDACEPWVLEDADLARS